MGIARVRGGGGVCIPLDRTRGQGTLTTGDEPVQPARNVTCSLGPGTSSRPKFPEGGRVATPFAAGGVVTARHISVGRGPAASKGQPGFDRIPRSYRTVRCCCVAEVCPAQVGFGPVAGVLKPPMTDFMRPVQPMGLGRYVWSRSEQANLPAEQSSAGQDPRFPAAHAHSCRPGNPRRPSPQGTRRALRLTAASRMPRHAAETAPDPEFAGLRRVRSARGTGGASDDGGVPESRPARPRG